MFCRLLATYEMFSVYKAQELRLRQRDPEAAQAPTPEPIPAAGK